MAGRFKVLFVYINPRTMSLVPPVVALFYRILKEHGIEMDYFDTSLYDMSSDYVNSDDFKEKMLTVKPYQKELHEKRGSLLDSRCIISDFRKKIEDFSPDLLATTAVESTFLGTIDLLNNVRNFGIPTVLGGVFATFASERAISFDEIDMLCVGEGEETIVELCERLRDGKSLDNIANLWVKGKNGNVTKNYLAPPVDIDNNPLPDMSIFEDRIFYRAMAGKVYRMFPVETHRGCPHACNFCNSPLQNKLYWDTTKTRYFRQKSIRLVIKEISYYHEKCGAEYLFFWADNFMTYSDKEIDEFCEFYSTIRLPFYAQSHPRQLSDYKLKRLKRVGLHRVGIGVEHGNEEFRRKIINRHYSNREVIDGTKILHKYDIPFSSNNICGFPREVPELVMDTVRLNRLLDPHTTGCSIFTPFHGTLLRKLAVEGGYLKDPAVIAPTNSETSILEMPQFTKEQILGKARTFNFYVHFPESRWKNIEKAEAITPEGDTVWKELRQEYMEKFGDGE